MKHNSVITWICAINVLLLFFVSCKNFDENVFFEDAKLYHLEDLKNFQIDTTFSNEGKEYIHLFTTNIDTFKQTTCNFSVKGNDVKFYAESFGYNLNGKIKSWRIDWYIKDGISTDTIGKGEIKRTYYMEFDTEQHCYFYMVYNKEIGTDYQISRFNTFGNRTQEILSFFRGNDNKFQFGSRHIIKYDRKGNALAAIQLVGQDTSIYYFTKYRFPEKNMTESNFYMKFPEDTSARCQDSCTYIYDNKGNLIQKSSKGSIINYIYDKNNRLQKVEEAENDYKASTKYFYSGDKLVKTEYYYGNTLTTTINITYNSNKATETFIYSDGNKDELLMKLDNKGNCIVYIIPQKDNTTQMVIHTIEYYD